MINFDLLKNKKVLAFDMDDTLGVSKSRIEDDMRKVLCELMHHYVIAVTSGGMFAQFEKQLIEDFDCIHIFEGRLVILPTSGSAMWIFDHGEWKKMYSEDFSPKESEKIIAAVNDSLPKVTFEIPKKLWGEQIEDRGSQVTLSMLGQLAPPDEKKVWDPNQEKRRELQALIQPLLPDFEVRVGGSTSIDITRKGVDKGYGMKKFVEHFGYDMKDVFFFGDRLEPGGNDYAVKEAGFDTYQVADHHETLSVLQELFTHLGE